MLKGCQYFALQLQPFTFAVDMSCITLLSDFGLQDASVASVKGILMQHIQHIPIVDITHLIEPFHLQQAAYLLVASYKNFPEHTSHLLLFDIFSESIPRLLLCEKDGHYFFAPDNGILSLAFGNEVSQVWKCFDLTEEIFLQTWVDKAADIIKQLQTASPAELGLELCELKNAPQHCNARIENNFAECQVIHIDRFENVVINITQPEFERIGAGRNFKIEFTRGEAITEISTHYYSVKEGDKLCRFNSSGYLEIAINRGKAASLFGLKLHRGQHLIYNTIKITFE